MVDPNYIMCVFTQHISTGPLAQTQDKAKHPSQERQRSEGGEGGICMRLNKDLLRNPMDMVSKGLFTPDSAICFILQ